MKNIVILGCGFAGMETAFWLRRLDTGDMNISVIDKNDTMVYTPSLIWLPPRRRELEDISIEIRPVLSKKGITFYHDEAVEIDAEGNTVSLASGHKLIYDYLVIAAGWRSKRDHIKGNENILFPCDFPDILTFTKIIGEMDGGSITVAIEGERPGPGAEYLGLLDVYLREKGLRHKFELNLAEEKHRLLIHLGREACDLVTANFEQRGINLFLGKNLVAARPGMAILEGDVEVPSDVTCAVGKLEAPELIQGLEFSAKDGFVPVNNDLSSKAYANIYVPGDACSYDGKNVPKVAHIAMEQGRIAARNIYVDISGGEKELFDPDRAFKELYILPDMGEITVLTKNYKMLRVGRSLSALKVGLEKYYLYTHRHGIPWQVEPLAEIA
ncbi:MAG TPA: FAD-dependent oxidoreductase [Anaerolineae bacterium]|nr:FAD-dependent oxidoreductase [Anaerolineae bacterium]